MIRLLKSMETVKINLLEKIKFSLFLVWNEAISYFCGRKDDVSVIRHHSYCWLCSLDVLSFLLEVKTNVWALHLSVGSRNNCNKFLNIKEEKHIAFIGRPQNTFTAYSSIIHFLFYKSYSAFKVSIVTLVKQKLH